MLTDRDDVRWPRPRAGVRWLLTLCLAAVLAGACGGPDTGPGTEAPTASTPTEEAGEEGGMTPATPGDIPDALLDTVLSDLAAREGVASDAARVVTVERHTWPDGALGCPRAGEMYTQALEQGFRVVLAVGEQEYDYRITDSGTLRRCAP